eukprot:s181_g11.t1
MRPALPVAALLYQEADNFWLRKLAHGRELDLIPTGTLRRWYSLLNFCHGPEIGASTLTGCHNVEPGKMVKQDAKARPSWKSIGQRLHRDPGSCQARWQYLKSTREELSHAPAEERADGD